MCLRQTAQEVSISVDREVASTTPAQIHHLVVLKYSLPVRQECALGVSRSLFYPNALKSSAPAPIENKKARSLKSGSIIGETAASGKKIGRTATPMAAKPQNAVSSKLDSNTGSVDIPRSFLFLAKLRHRPAWLSFFGVPLSEAPAHDVRNLERNR